MNKLFFLIIFIYSFSSLAEPSLKDDLYSPVTTSAKYFGLWGTLATGTLLVFEDQIVDPSQAEVVEDKPLGRYSRYGDLAGQLYPNLIYTAGMMLNYKFTGEEQSYNNGILMVKATAFASLATSILKAVVREPRPNDSNTKTSFPSGHTTTAFAFASTVANLHEWYWGVAAYSMATVVAFSRMNDNKHYIHDVFAGATIGTVYGLGVTNVFKESQTTDDKNTSFILIPSAEGLTATMSWRF